MNQTTSSSNKPVKNPVVMPKPCFLEFKHKCKTDSQKNEHVSDNTGRKIHTLQFLTENQAAQVPSQNP